MILVICAVILALAGFLLVISSLEIRKESDVKREYTYPDSNNVFLNNNADTYDLLPEDVSSTDQFMPEFNDEVNVPEDRNEFTHVPIKADDTPGFTEPEEIEVEIMENEDISIIKQFGKDEDHQPETLKLDNVVLYEDINSIISDDNFSKSLNIQDFSRLKRIGKGSFRIQKNSFEYSFDKKQFRFDFTRIKGITGEKNFILMKTKERSFQLFFMSESNENFSKIVKDKFKLKQ